MSVAARRLQRRGSSGEVTLPLTIAHGQDLRSPLEPGTNVGPAVLLGTNWQSQLWTPSVPGEGFYRVDAPQWNHWPASGLPTGMYVYNNNPSNHGGVVPAGGMTIDGSFVPGGTYVLQFADLPTIFYFADASFGFLLRGCRFRKGNSGAPGLFNVSSSYSGSFMGAHYCDIGGIGPQDADRFIVAFSIGGEAGSGAHVQMIGNYISYFTTAIQFQGSWVRSFELIENYIEKPCYYYGRQGPNGDGDDYHLNGVWISGGQTHCLILRNKITMQHPDELGRPVDQTDCIIWFQGGGANLGTGQNADGTNGYHTKDNYLGGAGWTIYAGKPDAKAANTAQNFTYTGNKITTQWWPNGGYFGPISELPLWGQYGNSQSNNTWADGSKAGQSFI